MQVYERTIKYREDGEEFTLVPFSDLHLMSANCEKHRFEDMLRKYGRANNTYLMDVGDALDCILTRDAKRFRPSAIDPDLVKGAVLQEDWIDTGIDWYCKMHEEHVDPSRFLGIASGNHMNDVLKYHNTDPTKRIAKRLHTENLGYLFFYRLNFKRPGKAAKEYMIFGNHGFGGGGRTEGGNMTKFCRDALTKDRVDLCLYAHTHDMWSKPVIKIRAVGKKLHEVSTLVVNTGTFLKTYSETEIPSYSEVAGYPPRKLGHVVIKITTPTDKYPYFRQEVTA